MALLYEDLSFEIRGMLMEVFNVLGPGFREETYKLAVLAEAKRRGLSIQREVTFGVSYKGQLVDEFRLDLVIEDKVILELKAVDESHPRHKAQLLSYLCASGLKLGMLVNFGADELKIIRLINEKKSNSAVSA